MKQTAFFEDSELVERLRSFFAAQPDVHLAYLFGSVGQGRATPLSDIDIAVYLDESVDAPMRFKRRLELSGILGKLLRRDGVDLVVLNDAPPTLAYEAISGVRLYERDRTERILVEARIIRIYLDRVYYEERHYRLFWERLGKRYGHQDTDRTPSGSSSDISGLPSELPRT